MDGELLYKEQVKLALLLIKRSGAAKGSPSAKPSAAAAIALWKEIVARTDETRSTAWASKCSLFLRIRGIWCHSGHVSCPPERQGGGVRPEVSSGH
eukprot:7167709-Prymnesium_polylepis.1